MAIVANLSVALGLESSRFRRGLDRSRRQTRSFTRRTSDQLRGLRNAFLGVAAAAASIGIGASFTRAVDTFTNINNLLRASGVSAEDLESTFAQVQQIALATRSDLASTANLFARITRVSGDLNATMEQVALATQTIQQSFILSGASAQEASNAVIQLGQALASGTLRGDELRSVLEQAPELARLIAAELGVGVGQLRDLAAEGMVTSDVVLRGILRGAEDINARFSETEATFEQLGNIFNARIVPVLARIGSVILPGVATALEFIARSVENAVNGVNRLNISLTQARTVLIIIGTLVARNIGLAGAAAIASLVLQFGRLVGVLITAARTLRTVAIFSALASRSFFTLAANLAALAGGFAALDALLPDVEDDMQQISDTIEMANTNIQDFNINLDNINVDAASQLNNRIMELDEGFEQVGRTIQTSVRDTLAEAFRTGELNARSFFNSITSSILQVASNALTNRLLGSVFAAIPSAGSFLGFNQGGVVPRIPGSRPGVDSVPALLTPGEIVTPAGEIPGGVTINNYFSVDTPETFRRQAEGSAGALADIIENEFAQRGIA